MASRASIDVGIADKSPLVLAGLKALLAGDPRFNLIFTASDGERFLEAVDRLPVEVAIIGWEMPWVDGAGVLKALEERIEAPRIVVYTGTEDPTVPRRVLALGGAAFCSKREPPDRLLDIAASVAEGRMVFPFMDLRRPASEDPLTVLSPRERELLASLGSGLTNAELARDLGLSINTVKFHLRNLFDKLQVKNRAQAVQLWATRER